MKILMVGDLVGGPGRLVFAQVAGRMRRTAGVDFVVVNAENAAGGNGITLKVADELFAAGADVITLGDHAWDQKEYVPVANREPRILRPANFAPGCPGHGCITVPTPHGPVTVISVIGRVFMKPNDCPFRAADAILAGPLDGKIRLVELHAEATSEKIVFGRYLDGRVSAVVGTHTHVQTSDDVVLPGGTGYLTDLGMTGVKDSAIGRDLKAVLGTFLTGMPGKFDLANGEALLEGVILDIDPKSGRTRRIERVREGMSGPAQTALR
ncbi:MAG TPA: metallophosphoesterase [Verrucomicrobia bacterium]|nr:metallophosphoesterase [Verrucomicrobiota bacterium]